MSSFRDTKSSDESAAAQTCPGWRWYLGLGIFIGYAAGALTIGGFWWWGW